MNEKDRSRTSTARHTRLTEHEMRLLRKMVEQGLTLRQIGVLFHMVRRLFQPRASMDRA